ncbi:alpha/beta-hydrolase [Aspergillus carlsbadensis]|nr:alpha/beta-hydrolase [Aspergillus carlsbadensis]
MAPQENVEFRTLDNTLLRGCLFSAQRRGPGIIMTPGFNATKEMLGLPTTAAAFQRAGITALTYDPRGVGLSDGTPRNDINPFQSVDDLSDALTFLLTHPSIDRQQGVALWGMSLGASIALVTAAVDPRARLTIAICPVVGATQNLSKLAPVLAKAAQDRESRLKGNDPFYVPMLTKTGENPAGFNLGFEKDIAMKLLSAQDVNDPLRANLAPNHVNRTTVGTYRNMLLWDPAHMWKHVRRPVLFVLAERDAVVGTETQKEHFAMLQGEKELYVQEGAVHMDILEGSQQEVVNRVQTEYVLRMMGSRIE